MRILVAYLVPLLLPTGLYFLWMWVMGRRVAAASGKGADAEARAREVPWTWLAAAGVALLLVSLGAWSVWEGASPSAVYVPPHMEDGKLVPGTMHEPK